jgi:hypothetical protein
MTNTKHRAKCTASIVALVVFSIACGGNDKQQAPAPAAPAIQSFTVAPGTPIAVGASATLLPTFTGGQGIVQPGGVTAHSGESIKVSPSSTTTYTLQVTNSATLAVSATAKVVVDTANATVGTAGAVLNSPTGASVEISPGALDHDVTITISATSQPAPANLEAVSPVYRFEPDGILFARPVRVSLPLPAGVTSGAVYWSRSGAGGSSATDFDSLGGTISNGVISVEAPHFSLAVIGPPTATRTVLGVGQTTWISATTRVNEPIDFASAGIEALVQDASGSFQSLPVVAGVGTFTIPEVPNGNYLLHSGTQYLVTSTSSPDLGVLSGGRPASQRTRVTVPTLLDVSLTGLDPWQDGDFLEFYDTEENDWDFDTERFIAVPPRPGDTSVSFQVDFSIVNGSFPNFSPGARSSPSTIKSQGDHLYFEQLSSRITDSGVPYTTLTRIAQVTPVDLANGGSASISANLLDVSTANTLSIDYRGTQWDAVFSDANPAGTNRKAFLLVQAQPGSADDGFYSSNADLLRVFPTLSDLVIGPISYGSPTNTTLAGNWAIFFNPSIRELISPVLPGARAGTQLFSGAIWNTSHAVVQAAPVTPPIRMPVNITVASSATAAGVPFFAADPARVVSGIGLTPTIAWGAAQIGQPASGEPPVYQLRVFQLSVVPVNNRTLATFMANIFTPELSFGFPPGILQIDHSYVFQLFANASTAPGPAARFATAPFKSAPDLATAGTVSSIFRP